MALFDQINFNEWVEAFSDVGGFSVILPFLLVFAVTFAVLQKIGLFGSSDSDAKGKKINAVVSLIMAAFLVSQTELVRILQEFLPRVSMIVVVLLMLLLVVGIFTKSSTWNTPALGIGVVIALVAIVWAIGAAAGWGVPLVDEITEQDVAVLLMLGVFVLVVWMVVKEPSGQDSGVGKSIGKLFESFRGGS